jgi:hypothetical protein
MRPKCTGKVRACSPETGNLRFPTFCNETRQTRAELP